MRKSPCRSGTQLRDAIDADDGRSVHARELRRIQPLLDRGDGVAHEILARAGVNGEVVVGRAQPVHVFQIDHLDPAVAAHGNARQVGALAGQLAQQSGDRILPLAEVLPGARDNA